MNLIKSNSLRQGIFFGISTGVITTAGLITSISQTTNDPKFIILSVLSVAISDGLSESYSIYLSKKAENKNDYSNGPILSSISLFFSKLLIMLSFLIPLIFTDDNYYFKNLYWTVIWSITIISIIDYKLAKMRKENFSKYLVSHLSLFFLVIILTKFLGIYLN